MKRFFQAGFLCAVLLLSGCSRNTPEAYPPLPDSTQATLEAAPAFPSYTRTGDPAGVVARLEDKVLTNDELQFWYGAEIAQYRRQHTDSGPDFTRPLDAQPCPGSDSSWQAYFLQAALNRWHTASALLCHSRENPLPLEETYRGNPELLSKYMEEMPVSKLLYGYDPYYRPNTLHQDFLENLAQEFSGAQLEMARTLNYGYMYFTTLTYQLEPVASEAGSEARVRFRHILLYPETGEDTAIQKAADLLKTWQTGRNFSESTFAQLASQYSQDTASAKSGGLYTALTRNQIPESLAQWCFDDQRQEGDTALIPTDEGVHLLYFSGWESDPELRQALQQQAQTELLHHIRSIYPMTVDYDTVALPEEVLCPSVSELLYPDIAHERFPEVPLYLQQNYLGTKYGDYKLTTNGCGITSLAMLGSYLTDEELTPPQLSALYGRYSRPTGTSSSLFEDAPPQLGFYLLKKTYDWREARDYMQEGHNVIVCQHKGYWTRGGHYLVLESLTEEGLVQVRDSNMANYQRLYRHKDDAFPWDTLSTGGHGYWIYEKKVTANDACIRCGDPEALEMCLVADYLCEKCRTAITRRDAYLHFS